jgi:hypothetical protein
MGASHEKANLACDCGSFDCSNCHPQWNERGYYPTGPTVSSCGFPYHPTPDVGVAALRQNHRAAAPWCTTHYGRVEAWRVPRFRSRQFGLVSPPFLIFKRRHLRTVTQEGPAFPQGPKQLLIGRKGLQKSDQLYSALGRWQTTVGLHGVAGHCLVRVRDEALEVFLIPNEVCAPHSAGIRVVW